MYKWLSLLFLTLPMLSYTNNEWESSWYFDTQFLRNYDQVKEALITDGFFEVAFPADDGYMIKGLYRKKGDARVNVVLAAGFYPGRKEGMATFIQLLPEDCNILLIDARGHGESEGPFWRTIPWYGKNEFKDIIGALNFLRLDNPKPNVLLGVCIGAFHCAHAALYLEEKNMTDTYNLSALIFDSGFGSIADLIWVPSIHVSEKIIPNACADLLYSQENNQSVKERFFYKIGAAVTKGSLWALTNSIAPFIRASDKQLNLFDKINRLSIPLLFIHSMDDDYTPFSHVQLLAECTRHKACWWIEKSEHACHQLKFKHEYRAQLLEFMNNSVHT